MIVDNWSGLRHMYANTSQKSCWVIGSGPSLDTYDLSQISHKDTVLACNAAITKVQHVEKAWWVFNNSTAYKWTVDKIDKNKGLRTISFDEQTRSVVDHGGRAYFYTREQAFPNHTTAETMLRIADHMGLRRAFMLGIDCLPTSGKPYARDLQYAHCIYENRQEEYFANFVYGLWKTSEELNIQVFTCSPFFPGGVFHYVTFGVALAIMRSE